MPIFRGRDFVSSVSDWKDSVRLASSVNVNLASSSITSIDGVNLQHADRILLAKQTAASQNGIYVWSSLTNQFVRARDADTGSEVTPGMKVYVEEGTTNAQSTFLLSNIGVITVGVTNLVFTKDNTLVQLEVDGTFGGVNSVPTIAVNKQGQVTSITQNAIYIGNTNLEFNSITINGSDIPLGAEATFDTDDWTEGTTNLYYTDTRARTAISVSGDLSYDSATGVISYTAGETLPTQTGNSGKYLTTDGTTASWAQVDFASTLDQLTDVDTTGVNDNYTLVYDSSSSTWLAEQSVADGTIIDGGSLDGPSSGSGVTTISDVHNIDELADVVITNPSNGQVIKYNGTNWVNDTDSTGTTIDSINDITDVTITTPTSGQVLKYNGIAWVNDTDSGGIALTDLSVGAEALASGDGAISYNNTTGVFTYTPPDLSSYSTFSGSYADLTDKPTLFSGDYADLTNTPTIPSLAGYATETYVNSAVANIVDSAPTVLDTLNELAAALGDDPNFATTISNQIGLKANSADLATVATTGDYTDLINTPTIPDITGKLNLSGGTMTGSLILSSAPTAELEAATKGYVDAATASANINSIGDISDVTLTLPEEGQILKYNGIEWVNGSDATGTGIALTDLSVTTNSVGTAALSYDNVTGVFTYTPPDLTLSLDGNQLSMSGGNTVTLPAAGGSGSPVTVSETAPTSPSEGDLWYDPSTLETYIYYLDGNNNYFWVSTDTTAAYIDSPAASVGNLTKTYYWSGDLELSTGTLRYYFNSASTIVGVNAFLVSAGSGTSTATIVKNGQTVVSTINMTSGQTANIQSGLDITLSSQDYLTINITAVSSGASDLYINIVYQG